MPSLHEITSLEKLYEVLGLENGQKIESAGKQYKINIPAAPQHKLPVIQEESPFSFAECVKQVSRQNKGSDVL